MQNVPGWALEPPVAPFVGLVLLRNRRDNEAFVIAGRQEETNRVKEMETLANDDLIPSPEGRDSRLPKSAAS